MSRDIFVQDLPVGVESVDEIPDDWEPRPLPFGHQAVVESVLHLSPDADIADPTWLHVLLPGAQIEVNVTDESPLWSFALHLRATDHLAAETWVTRLLTRLGARALDPETEGGIFHG